MPESPFKVDAQVPARSGNSTPLLGRALGLTASASVRDNFHCDLSNDLALTIIVLGASGDLAKKKTFPALFELFRKRCAHALPPHGPPWHARAAFP